ncbi:hypothetical protein [Roseofilum capinflatum]|uniref:Uncharacterized protein n=1 Tax=Roseofilum capinflatum BLCC-M114 TaxID=3022440 RepID=A0ABT7B9U9_9CYAN|nr:hypothetical protein [Roseofilum capinflatum]MDJ1175880.1 hypothetical protein [Roseofilum capinflatum BLCC-M114]
MEITGFEIFRDAEGHPLVYGMNGESAIRAWTPTTKQELIDILRRATHALDVPAIMLRIADAIAPPDQPLPIPLPPSPFEVEIREADDKWYATLDGGSQFKVGTDVSYLNRRGLMLVGDKSAGVYNPSDYDDLFGFWAYFIAPTAECESQGSFNCLNSYDRAKFTFGFLQYAAHVCQGDFVKYFCQLLQTDEAQAYFPDLRTDGQHIYQMGNPDRRLTSNDGSDNKDLMAYLNQTDTTVDRREVMNAAKFVHWVSHSEVHRAIMVECGVTHFKAKMKTLARQHGLDQAPDYVCCVVADIRHQGRAKIRTINRALSRGNTWEEKYRSVVELTSRYAERVATLKAQIAKYRERGIFGTRKYSRALGDFV